MRRAETAGGILPRLGSEAVEHRVGEWVVPARRRLAWPHLLPRLLLALLLRHTLRLFLGRWRRLGLLLIFRRYEVHFRLLLRRCGRRCWRRRRWWRAGLRRRVQIGRRLALRRRGILARVRGAFGAGVTLLEHHAERGLLGWLRRRRHHVHEDDDEQREQMRGQRPGQPEAQARPWRPRCLQARSRRTQVCLPRGRPALRRIEVGNLLVRHARRLSRTPG